MLLVENSLRAIVVNIEEHLKDVMHQCLINKDAHDAITKSVNQTHLNTSAN